jgi:RecG-like helicase
MAAIESLQWREPAEVEGRVRSVCIQPRAGVATLEATLWDDTGGVTVVWLGRRHVNGIRPGATIRVSGVLGDHHGKLAFLNPTTELVAR